MRTSDFVFMVVNEYDDMGRKFTPGEILNVERGEAAKAYRLLNLYGTESAFVRLPTGHHVPLENLKRQPVSMVQE